MQQLSLDFWIRLCLFYYFDVFQRMGGWKKFITSHPNEFALVDDRVILLQDPIPRAVRQAQSSSAKRSSATNSDDKFTPPSKTTVAKIS